VTPPAATWRDPENTQTIAEAATALGVGERRLRRLLERPEYASRTVSVTRQTKTGTRQAVTVPPALLDDIRQLIEIETNAANGDSVSATRKASAVVHDQSAEVARLQGEVEWLRGQIEQHNVSESELRRLMMADKAELSELRQRLALPAAPDVDQAKTQPRSWWQFWKRGS
jgi:hypothetical protein